MGIVLLEEEVGTLLKKKRFTLAVAESCSGGLLGHRVTSVRGSSAYFLGGIIAYANEAKINALGVSSEVIKEEGAVSEIVARLMAKGVREKYGADVGLAITGIAGPDGGTAEKPVGLVYVGLAGFASEEARKYIFKGDRSAIKESSSEAALELLKEFLKQ